MSEVVQGLVPQRTQDKVRFGGLGPIIYQTGIGISHDRGEPGSGFQMDRVAFAGAQLTSTHGLNYGSLLLGNFPTGRVIVLSALASLNWTVSSGANTITAGTAGAWSIGHAPTSSSFLAGFAQDILPSTNIVAGTQNAPIAVSNAVMGSLGATGFLDGTAVPIPIYLNLSMATNANNDGVMSVTSGYLDLLWAYCGDL